MRDLSWIVPTTRRRRGVLVVLVVVTALMATIGVVRLRVDSAITDLLPRDAATRAHVERFSPGVADMELMPIVLETLRTLTLPHMRSVAELLTELQGIHGVRVAATPFSLIGFEIEGGRLIPRPLAPGGGPPTTANALAVFRDRLRTAAPTAHDFIGDGQRSLTLLLSIEPRPSYRALLSDIRAAARRVFAATDVQATIGGFIPLYVETEQRLARDLPLLGGVGAALAVVVLLAAFGATCAVLMPLAAVTISLVWVAGLMAATGTPITVVTLMLPPLLFALGSSYGVHLISGGAAKIGETAETVALAALTTAAGFCSLTVSALPRLRQFGVFAAVGILITAAITVLLAVLVSGPNGRRVHDRPMGFVGRAATAAAGSAARRSALWAATTVVALAAVGLAVVVAGHGLRYQTDVAQLFRGDSASVQANRRAMAAFGSFVSLQLTVLQPAGDDAFPSVELLAALDRFENDAMQHPNVAGVTSLAGQLRAMNRARTGGERLPAQSGAIHLLLRLLDAVATNGGDTSLGGLLKPQRREVTTQLWVLDAQSEWLLDDQGLQDLVHYLEGSADDAFADTPFDANLWGWSLVTLQVSQILAREQLLSIGASAAVVFALVAVAFRSLLTALAAMVPLAAGLAVTYALVALLSIPVDAITISFASIAIGVGVDDAAHLLLHFRRAVRAGSSRRTAARLAVKTAGRAIVITSITIIVGMGALAASAFLPIAYLGMLVAVTLLGTTAAALGILPTLIGFQLRGGAERAPASPTT